MARKASKRLHRRSGRSARRDRKTKRLLVEPLEHRTLLSASVSNPAPEITSLSVTPAIDENGVADLSGEFYHQAQEMSGLAARWLGDGDGQDAHGDNHASTVYHVGYAEGKVDDAFSFNGTNSYLRTPYQVSAGTPTTISAWIKPSALSRSAIVKIGDKRSLYLTPNQVCFGGTKSHLGTPAQGVYANASNAGMLGQWSHVAGTWDGTTARIYINGVLQTENSIATGNEGGPFPDTSIGYGISGYGYFKGLIDEVRIYERALPLDEIRALHQLREPGPQQTYTLSVDWGDGATDTFHYTAPTDHFRETHQYLDDGPAGTASDDYRIEITLAADFDPEDPAQASVPVTVNNVAPVITALSATADTDENEALVLSGRFADPAAFASDLAGWWTGDGHADDVYGGHHAALYDGTTFAQGTLHEAFAFDGANDYARAAYTMSADIPTTVSAWINPSRHAKDAIVTIGDTRHLYLAGDGRVCYAATSTSLAIPFRNTAVIANGALPLNTWSNVIGAWDGTTARIYVNGVLADENSIVEGQSFNLFPDTCIGYGISGYGHFQGSIDEVRIYERALSPDEVQVLHAASGPGGADQHTLDIDWGDGCSQIVDLLPGARSFSLEHQYPDDPAGRPDEYTITAEVTDDDSETDVASVRVLAVLPPTDLTLSGGRVPEHSPVGTVVGDFSVVDADPRDSHTFTLLDDAGGRFALVGSRLVVAGAAAIDFETDDSHEVRVRVTDSIGFELEKTFTIEVVDVEETPFVVNSFYDTRDANPGDGIAADTSGNTTLRAAIMEANALPGDDSIVLPAGDFTISRDYWLDDDNLGGDFDITDTTGSLTITGAGADSTTICAAQLDRAFDLLRDTEATIADLLITHGHTWRGDLPSNPDLDMSGGGIRARHARLALERVHVVSSGATMGGGLCAGGGTVSIKDGLFSGNGAHNQKVWLSSGEGVNVRG